jgi:hypothetical protein
MTEQEYRDGIEILTSQRNAAMDEIVRMGVMIKARDRQIKALVDSLAPIAPDAPKPQS